MALDTTQLKALDNELMKYYKKVNEVLLLRLSRQSHKDVAFLFTYPLNI